MGRVTQPERSSVEFCVYCSALFAIAVSLSSHCPGGTCRLLADLVDSSCMVADCSTCMWPGARLSQIAHIHVSVLVLPLLSMTIHPSSSPSEYSGE